MAFFLLVQRKWRTFGYGYGVFATHLDASVYIDMQCNADVFSLVSWDRFGVDCVWKKFKQDLSTFSATLWISRWNTTLNLLSWTHSSSVDRCIDSISAIVQASEYLPFQDELFHLPPFILISFNGFNGRNFHRESPQLQRLQWMGFTRRHNNHLKTARRVGSCCQHFVGWMCLKKHTPPPPHIFHGICCLCRPRVLGDR